MFTIPFSTAGASRGEEEAHPSLLPWSERLVPVDAEP